MTLRDVARRTGGRFKASVLGGYERGERAISLERFCELAGTYGVDGASLLGDIEARLRPSEAIVVQTDGLAISTGADVARSRLGS